MTSAERTAQRERLAAHLTEIAAHQQAYLTAFEARYGADHPKTIRQRAILNATLKSIRDQARDGE